MKLQVFTTGVLLGDLPGGISLLGSPGGSPGGIPWGDAPWKYPPGGIPRITHTGYPRITHPCIPPRSPPIPLFAPPPPFPTHCHDQPILPLIPSTRTGQSTKNSPHSVLLGIPPMGIWDLKIPEWSQGTPASHSPTPQRTPRPRIPPGYPQGILRFP